jgi:hypothetical protein
VDITRIWDSDKREKKRVPNFTGEVLRHLSHSSLRNCDRYRNLDRIKKSIKI